jgi:AcrR family transcriptional regulator
MPRTSERRPVTRLDPAVRRTQIVESAARLFERRDPVEVPFEEIAESAGVSRALVYNYFGDRGGLLAAVYLHHFQAVNDHLAKATDPHSSPEERIRGTVRAYLEYAALHPGAWRLLHVARANDHPAVVEARSRRMVELARLWGGSVEARIVACAVVGLLEAATVEWLTAARDDVTDDRLGEVLADLLWQGLAGLGRHKIAVPEVSARSSGGRP